MILTTPSRNRQEVVRPCLSFPKRPYSLIDHRPNEENANHRPLWRSARCLKPAEAYVLSCRKHRRFNELKARGHLWIKAMRFKELVDLAGKTQNIIFQVGKKEGEGLRTGDPGSRFASTTAAAELEFGDPINRAHASRLPPMPLACIGCRSFGSGPKQPPARPFSLGAYSQCLADSLRRTPPRQKTSNH